MVSSKCGVFVLVLAGMFAAGSAGVAAGQSAAAPAVTLESLAGVWGGSAAQTPNGEVPLRVEFKLQDGRLSGVIESSLGVIPIVSASLVEDKLTMTIDFQGSAGALAGKVQGARIEGTWEVSGASGPFSLTRGGAPGASSPAGDVISGAWAGEVQIAGQTMAFSMVLRLSGDAIAGEMMSAAGSIPIASGSWKDGALQFTFPYSGGEPVSMGAQLKDGRLVGVVDYNRGTETGTWTASRKQ